MNGMVEKYNADNNILFWREFFFKFSDINFFLRKKTMVVLFPCVLLFINAVRTMHTGTLVPSTTATLLNVPLDGLSKFNDIRSFQESFSKKAETLPHTLFKSQHLPEPCGFSFEALSSSNIGWQINCVPEWPDIFCALGRIKILDDEKVRLKIQLLYNKTAYFLNMLLNVTP